MIARVLPVLLVCSFLVGCEKGSSTPQTVVTSVADPNPQPGKGYDPVSADDVPNMKLNHYFVSGTKGSHPDFIWTFTKDSFTIKKDTGPIPEDLIKKLLTKGATAEEITGKWKIDDGKIVFTDIKAGGKPGQDKVSLSIYRTAPTVIRMGEPQYVFAVGQK